MLTVSCQKIDNARETGEHLPLGWRQLAYLNSQCMIAFLEEGSQERVILGLQKATKTRVEISSLISEEIHTTGALHTLSPTLARECKTLLGRKQMEKSLQAGANS
jgi:hypothetical protein